MNKVIGLFSSVSAEELPVAEDELFVGMISKSDVLAGYRNKLIRKSKELS